METYQKTSIYTILEKYSEIPLLNYEVAITQFQQIMRLQFRRNKFQ